MSKRIRLSRGGISTGYIDIPFNPKQLERLNKSQLAIIAEMASKKDLISFILDKCKTQ